jgi:NADH-quinone oxidoreductase subunit D
LRVILKLDGEKVLGAECVIGYLHRGVEKIAENRTYTQFGPYVDRMDYVASVSNGLGYCETVEKLINVEAPPRAQHIRVILTELNRITSHQVWLGTHALDLGAMTPVFYCFRDREEILKIFEKYCGARLTTHAFRIGGCQWETYEGFEKEVLRFCDFFEPKIDEYEQLLTTNRIWIERTKGVGVISGPQCIAMGVTGPVLRGSGVKWDLRKAKPYSGYEKFDFEIPTGENGDTYDRYIVRIKEMRQSVRIIRQVLAQMPDGPIKINDQKIAPPPRAVMKQSMEALIHHFKLYTEGYHVPAGETYTVVEAPKGEFGVYLVADGTNRPYRCKIRAPGFAFLQATEFMSKGHMLADIVAIIGSMDIVFGEIDR